MKVFNRYFAHEVYNGTLLVFSALLVVFAFLDLVHQLENLGKGNYNLLYILAYVALQVPGRIYELFPIAALIGSLYALVQLANYSEITVMRVSGVSAARMALSLLRAGLLFVLLTFVVGEFIAPPSDRLASQLQIRAMNSVVAQEFRSGLWVKDGASFVNVKEVLPDSALVGVRIYEFDPNNALRAISFAREGKYLKDNSWLLTDVEQTRFEASSTQVTRLPQAYWNSVLNPDMLSVLLVVPEQMSAWNLYFYVQHLRDNKQKTSRFEIALWNKLVYPFATLVMMLMALPFAFLQSRLGGVSGKVFGGVMLGLTFHLLNRVFANLGVLHDWSPPFSAGFPTLLFFVSAVAYLWWQERR
jgi:lipopolysaccharide export system permease protein